MKFVNCHSLKYGQLSLPSRECGLKLHVPFYSSLLSVSSLPSRECGLKSKFADKDSHAIQVTPFAGVWIEMPIDDTKPLGDMGSLPSRECGLKYDMYRTEYKFRAVTPFAGVWIEIFFLNENHFQQGSLPSRECGLKF